MRFVSLVLGAVAMLAPAGAAQAQNAPQVSIYEQRSYEGTPVTVAAPTPDLGRSVRMRSLRVTGGAWELCEQANYQGRCARFSSGDADVRGMVREVRSVRPAGPIGERG